MIQRFLNFARGLATNWIGSLGIALTTTSFIIFIAVEFLRVLGIVTGSYSGLVTYMSLPLIFVMGLLLIPLGWRRYRARTGLPTRELLQKRFSAREVAGGVLGSRVFQLAAVLTVANLIFLGAGTARMLHFMEGPKFCGTACHDVMGPEWATYQESPHANVRCVDCHVGEGFQALVDSKINGLWQIVSATFDLYERPIPTPVHQLRPARETCQKCHWPDKFYGDRIMLKTRFGFDRNSSPSYTTLSMKVGSGAGRKRGEIHWHVAEDNMVRYSSVDDEREEMIWVEVLQPDGGWRRYRNRLLADHSVAEESVRTLDCVDCHNRATHIYENPENAVDERISAGLIDIRLPYVKREALAALTVEYPDREQAMAGIENRIRGFYARNHRSETMGLQDAVDRTIAALQAAHRRNIHHGMEVEWGSYPSHLGHEASGGCFRCHNPNLIAEDGETISDDCTLCHSILSYDSDRPFRFLMPAVDTDPDFRMHQYLQEEFLQTLDQE